MTMQGEERIEPASATTPAQVGRDVLAAAGAAQVKLRLTGGVAVSLRAPSALRAPLRREYGDIDFVGLSDQAHEIGELFHELGFLPDEEFNLLHGQRRLYFRDARGYEADVFLDRIEGCHRLELRDRLDAADLTLAPADLLLSKLQVVQTNHKDFVDAIALLADHDITDGEAGINRGRLVEVCASDWGWWRTVTMVAERAREVTTRLAADAEPTAREGLAVADSRLEALLDELARAPKSRRWKLRARVGDRVRWYELPEDIEHEE